MQACSESVRSGASKSPCPHRAIFPMPRSSNTANLCIAHFWHSYHVPPHVTLLTSYLLTEGCAPHNYSTTAIATICKTLCSFLYQGPSLPSPPCNRAFWLYNLVRCTIISTPFIAYPKLFQASQGQVPGSKALVFAVPHRQTIREVRVWYAFSFYRFFTPSRRALSRPHRTVHWMRQSKMHCASCQH